MPILNSAGAMHAELTAWRRHLHANPELEFDTTLTSAFVADKLRAFGCDEVVTGVGRSGVVGIVRGARGDGPAIGLRADMDALPIVETGSADHASTSPGKMHACGHDGHTVMLLGAARHLAETRNFAGTAVLIFQPAEEIGQGALAMLDDHLMERFGIERVFGMHNMPGIPAGHFAVCEGPIMASASRFTLTIRGKGGHAARPHSVVDPIVIGSQIVTALQSIVSRSTDPLHSVVISVTRFSAGTAYNIIPEEIEIWGTVRTLQMELVAETERRIHDIATKIAGAHGATVGFHFHTGCGVTYNRAEEARFSGETAIEIVGAPRTDLAVKPVLAGEDFSHMLAARPGSFVFIGNGDTAGLHHPAYDFNDAILPEGVSYWVRLTERALPPNGA